MKRILTFLFNTVRNLCLLICLLQVGGLYLLSQHEPLLRELAAELEREEVRREHLQAAVTTADYLKEVTAPEMITVGNESVNTAFVPDRFVYATTTDKPNYIDLVLTGGGVHRRRGSIVQLRRDFPTDAPQLFKTGGLLLNMGQITGIDRDTLRMTRSRIYTLTLRDGCEGTDSIQLPTSQNRNFDRRYADFKRLRR